METDANGLQQEQVFGDGDDLELHGFGLDQGSNDSSMDNNKDVHRNCLEIDARPEGLGRNLRTGWEANHCGPRRWSTKRYGSAMRLMGRASRSQSVTWPATRPTSRGKGQTLRRVNASCQGLRWREPVHVIVSVPCVKEKSLRSCSEHCSLLSTTCCAFLGGGVADLAKACARTVSESWASMSLGTGAS